MVNKIRTNKGGKLEVKNINLVSKYFLAKTLIATKHGGGGKTGIDYDIILTDPEVFELLAETEDISVEMITISYKDEILFNGRIETMYIDIFIDDIKYENVRLVKNKNKSGNYIIEKTSHKFIMSVNILSSNVNSSETIVVEEETYSIKEVQKGGTIEEKSKLKGLIKKGGSIVSEWKEKYNSTDNKKYIDYGIDAAWIITGIATAYCVVKS